MAHYDQPAQPSSASNQPSGVQEQIAVGYGDIVLSTSTESNYIRRIIDFPRSTFDVLEELAKGRSIGDAIRDAIALSKWFKDIREDGARIFVERNGKLREVITIKYPPDK